MFRLSSLLFLPPVHPPAPQTFLSRAQSSCPGCSTQVQSDGCQITVNCVSPLRRMVAQPTTTRPLLWTNSLPRKSKRNPGEFAFYERTESCYVSDGHRPLNPVTGLPLLGPHLAGLWVQEEQPQQYSGEESEWSHRTAQVQKEE